MAATSKETKSKTITGAAKDDQNKTSIKVIGTDRDDQHTTTSKTSKADKGDEYNAKTTEGTKDDQHSATSVKIASLTGAAKDDQLNATITGLADLNVLSNDPGAAKIYSLAQDTAARSGTAQFPVSSAAKTLAGASISINADGTVHYDAGAISQVLQDLAQDEKFTDSFIYTVRMANGALSTATAMVTIVGVNDAPILASIAPITVNDTAADDAPAAITGQLVGSDVDHGAALTYSLAQGVSGSSDYGTFVLNAAGAYAFAADPTALNALAYGENKTVSFDVLVADEHGATDTKTVQFNLVGANDGPTLASVDPVTLNDTAADDAPAAITGQLVGSDVDHGAALTYSFAQGVSGSSDYGTFALNAAGAYAFAADPTALNALAYGENKTVSFDVLVADEHGATDTKTVQFNLVGANDAAEISGVTTGAVTEDSILVVGGTLAVSDRDHGQSLFVADGLDLTGDYGNFTFNSAGEWSYSLRNSDASVQALNSGNTRTDSLQVSSFDGSATKTISIAVNGADEAHVVLVNPVINHMVNYGLADKNGRQTFYGFDSNDKLTFSNNYNYVADSLQHVDAGNDGIMDSSAQFINNQHHTVTIVLVGYADLTISQIAAVSA